MKSKAQIKMFENVAVMIVFFFLLVLGFRVYYSYQEQALSEELRDILETRTFQLVERLTALPELECSVGSVEIPSCIDLLKSKSLQNYIKKNPEKYFTFFGFSTIEIKPVYGEPIIVYNNTPKSYTSMQIRHLPVLLYDAKGNAKCVGVSGNCFLANLKVSVYEEE